jgi:hypothetical protein
MGSQIAGVLTRRQRLTRRANHLHMFNIARILSPRRETGRGLFESDGSRI